jgi:hypothetical protein
MHPDISDMVLDLAERAIEAGSKLIILDLKETAEELDIFLSDSGSPKDAEAPKKESATDGALYKDLGLGFENIRKACERTGGRFDLEKNDEMGTSFYLNFKMGRPESPDVGDIPELFTYCMIFDGNYELVINRFYLNEKYSIVRSEIYATLGELNDSRTIALLRKYFEGYEEEIHAKTQS